MRNVLFVKYKKTYQFIIQNQNSVFFEFNPILHLFSKLFVLTTLVVALYMTNKKA